MPRLQVARPERPRSGWRHLARRLALAFLLFLLMSFNFPLSGSFVFALVPVTLVVWGALVAGIAAWNLFADQRPIQLAWTCLTVGACVAVSVPAIARGTPAMLDALGAVVALTLVPHLARRQLGSALRDWAVVIGLSLFAAMGVQAMWVLVSSLGLAVFFIVAVVPPLLFEALMLLFDRTGRWTPRRYAIPLIVSSTLAVALLSLTQFNRSMPAGWVLIFGLVVGILIGAGLLLSYMTRQMAEAASGAEGKGNPIARSLVELSHGPVIISLALYLPLSLLR